ncbi:family 10 glycosylhydrolase [Streptomyces sp. 549]|uniref:glycoside hydrolase family 10 protein n=1 Tax=Streptomyces sp. 549 TaxID=3049076 RepID=UPI0024C2A3E3|nr:family 10 glycosylhydrolase [Streptomyces sp. 549]MDK1473489.1 family 10 glycosylhydrolase [Streptomyces sp. 549]
MARITRRMFTAAAAGALSGPLAVGSALADPPPREGHAPPPAGGGGSTAMRGMWVASVANIDWPARPGLDKAEQQAQLLAHLDTAVRCRLNTVILQVRPTADAFWPSPHEPWSEWLTGRQGRHPGWDPLGFAVREAHARGLELHAWFNPYRVAQHTDRSKLVDGHPARRHPDWVVAYGGKLYYNPGLPAVRRFVQDAMLDAVERYDVDAVHWDDYFYPYPVAGAQFDDSEAFRTYGGGFSSRAAWRRHNIDLLVKETSQRLRRDHAGVRFGVSPFAVWRNRSTDPLGSDTRGGVQTYDDLYADTRKWVKQGWVDHIVPQVYWHLGFAPADYAELVAWWSEVVRGTGVDLYVGEALYKVAAAGQPEPWHDPAELSRHLHHCRRHPEVKGNVFFSAKGVSADPIGAMSQVVRDHYRTRG